jgi:HAD domain family 1 in Swiss Army Knife RNA repair proteins
VEQSGEKMKIRIFDFDKTLVRTTDRDQAEKLYLAAKGVAWPHIGFYGRPESLVPPVFPELPDESYLIQEVAEVCRRKDCDLQILMTGRPYKLKKRVLDICDHFGLKFDQTYFKGQKNCNNSGDTLAFKICVLEELIILGPSELEMWEDRDDHYEKFQEFFNTVRNHCATKFTLYKVVA